MLDESVYGLAPWYREQIRQASLVAVPGCYPISVLLPLRPLLDAPLSDVPVVIDSISGISGAGKTPSEAFHFPEMNENVKAYKLAVHQHIPEIEQELLHEMKIQFTACRSADPGHSDHITCAPLACCLIRALL